MQNDDPQRQTAPRVDTWLALAVALSLLSLLAPLPRPRATSETPWFVELITTAVLGCCILLMAYRDGKYLARLFTARSTAEAWMLRLFCCYATWALLSALWASSPYLPLHHGLVWCEYILFYLFIRERLAAGGHEMPTRIFATTSAIVGVLTIIEFATLPDFGSLEGTIRLRYGAYAELLVAFVPPLVAAAAFATDKRNGRYMAISAFLGWLAVMLSLSKGAFIAGIAGLGVAFAGLIVFGTQRTRRRSAFLMGAMLILTIAVQAGFSLFSPLPATVDYISGKADASRETSLARVFVWKVGFRMVERHWLFGVGADNFGVAFNDARADYRLDHPETPPNEPVSDNLIARAHNEVLQVAAELGLIGLVLFALPFGVVIVSFIKRCRVAGPTVMTPRLAGALGGMIAFGLSSMVSSFSFRLVQNGIAFFIVFSVAVAEMVPEQQRKPISTRGLKVAAFGVFIAAVTVFGSKGVAEYMVYAAGREPDRQTAIDLYHRAVSIDPAYSTALLQSSARSYSAGDHAAAAAEIRTAIDGGCGVVLTYAALATSQERIDDLAAAEATFGEAMSIFPRSVFLRVRYSLMLEKAGRAAEADGQFATARAIDPRQADGWRNLITVGSVRSFYAAREDPRLAAPAELLPEAAVLEYLDELPKEPVE